MMMNPVAVCIHIMGKLRRILRALAKELEEPTGSTVIFGGARTSSITPLIISGGVVVFSGRPPLRYRIFHMMTNEHPSGTPAKNKRTQQKTISRGLRMIMRP